MATYAYWLWSLLLLCISCSGRLPEAGINTASVDTSSQTSFIYNTFIADSLSRIVDEPRLPDAVILSIQVKTVPKNKSVTDVYLSQLGVREATGHNDGKAVEMYLRAVGLGRGYPWCAAFVRWCFDSAHIATNINGAAASAHNAANLVWFKHRQVSEPRAADVFTLWYPSLNRIGHTGFYHSRVNNSVYESVEGNTNEGGAREGDGVYKKYRSFNATYSISRWKN